MIVHRLVSLSFFLFHITWSVRIHVNSEGKSRREKWEKNDNLSSSNRRYLHDSFDGFRFVDVESLHRIRLREGWNTYPHVILLFSESNKNEGRETKLERFHDDNRTVCYRSLPVGSQKMSIQFPCLTHILNSQ